MLMRSSVILFSLAVLCLTRNVLGGAIEKAFEESGSSDVSQLYKVVLSWYNDHGAASKSEAVEVFHHLADSQNHVMSAVKLGHHYAAGGSPDNFSLAVKYFAQAGENGPHHASLFNAGRLLAEYGDWVGALAYLKAAATLHHSYPPEYISDDTTKSALASYDIISRSMARADLTIVQIADMFVFGSLDDLPEDAQGLWSQAIHGLIKFNHTFFDTSEKTQDEKVMTAVAKAFRGLWEKYGAAGTLSDLQTYLLLNNMNTILGLLAGMDDAYVPMAAGYAEALATHSLYCLEHYAKEEGESACFNFATASAISFYRRAEDNDSAKRVLQKGQQHLKAATHWTRLDQTPHVYHSELTAIAWWNADDFSAAQSLSKAYQSAAGTILTELKALKALPDGQLQRADKWAHEVDIDASGQVREFGKHSVSQGFQRISSPYIGVRTESPAARETGAGGWAEFGPLFNGVSWNEEACEVVPTICGALRNDPSLCSSRATKGSSKNVWQLCGTDSVITILRLRPGTTILPHCGTTNSRLTMQFALEGTDGVKITVGDSTVTNYNGGDGHALVFDDSFENSSHHDGQQDQFIVRVVLSHPDLL